RPNRRSSDSGKRGRHRAPPCASPLAPPWERWRPRRLFGFLGLVGTLDGGSEGTKPREEPARRQRSQAELLDGAERSLQPRHLALPPPVADLVYQLPRPRRMAPRLRKLPLVAAEARPFEMRVARVKPHRAALGDLLGLGEVRHGAGEVGAEAPEGGAGQEA